MLTLIIFSIIANFYIISRKSYFKLFIILTIILKIFLTLLMFSYFSYDILSVYKDQHEYINYATTIYSSSNPFGTYGNISHYLYIFMLTFLLNLYDDLNYAIADLVISQLLVSILTHIFIFKLISIFINSYKLVFLISLVSILFLTTYAYNIFVIRDSWYFLFVVMAIYYFVNYKYLSSSRSMFGFILCIIMLLQFRFFTAMFIVSTIYIVFNKNKFRAILQLLMIIPVFIIVFSLFYNPEIIFNYLISLMELDVFINFIIYMIEGFFNLSFLSHGEYGPVTKIIRLFIPETIFVLIITFVYFKIKRIKVDFLDKLISFVVILTFLHIGTYFFFSGAEWKIRQSGILSILFVILVLTKYTLLKTERFKNENKFFHT